MEIVRKRVKSVCVDKIKPPNVLGAFIPQVGSPPGAPFLAYEW